MSLPGKVISPKEIKNIIAEYFGFQSESLNLRWGFTEIKDARQIAMFFIRKKTELTLQEIADEFSSIRRFNHSTVSHAIKRINEWSETNKAFRQQINEIEQKLN